MLPTRKHDVWCKLYVWWCQTIETRATVWNWFFHFKPNTTTTINFTYVWQSHPNFTCDKQCQCGIFAAIEGKSYRYEWNSKRKNLISHSLLLSFRVYTKHAHNSFVFDMCNNVYCVVQCDRFKSHTHALQK